MMRQLSISLFFLLCTAHVWGFENDYKINRQNFLDAAEAALKGNSRGELSHYPHPSDSDLATDVLYLPAEEDQKGIIVMVSGVHGLETPAGSGLQTRFLKSQMNLINSKKYGLLMVHALNAWGHAHHRRVNQNNVDLNRNFHFGTWPEREENRSYQKLNSFLNPEKPIEDVFMPKLSFYFQAIRRVISEGIPSLRQAIVGGQFEFSKGIFFGGNHLEHEAILIRTIVEKYLIDQDRILLVDFHTGYGERGKLHLFGFKSYPDHVEPEIRRIFKGLGLVSGLDGDFYETKGDLTQGIFELIPEKMLIPMTFEFGTMNSQTTKGSLESLRRTIRENQNHHYPSKKKVSDQAKQEAIELFNPAEKEWIKSVIKENDRVLPVVLERFMNFE